MFATRAFINGIDTDVNFAIRGKTMKIQQSYHPKLYKAVLSYMVIQLMILVSTGLAMLLGIFELTPFHQGVAAVTLVIMVIQLGLIFGKSKMALAMEGPRLLVFPMMWLAAGMGEAAFIYAICCVSSLIILMDAVRFSNLRRYPRNRHYILNQRI